MFENERTHRSERHHLHDRYEPRHRHTDLFGADISYGQVRDGAIQLTKTRPHDTMPRYRRNALEQEIFGTDILEDNEARISTKRYHESARTSRTEDYTLLGASASLLQDIQRTSALVMELKNLRERGSTRVERAKLREQVRQLKNEQLALLQQYHYNNNHHNDINSIEENTSKLAFTNLGSKVRRENEEVEEKRDNDNKKCEYKTCLQNLEKNNIKQMKMEGQPLHKHKHEHRHHNHHHRYLHEQEKMPLKKEYSTKQYKLQSEDKKDNKSKSRNKKEKLIESWMLKESEVGHVELANAENTNLLMLLKSKENERAYRQRMKSVEFAVALAENHERRTIYHRQEEERWRCWAAYRELSALMSLKEAKHAFNNDRTKYHEEERKHLNYHSKNLSDYSIDYQTQNEVHPNLISRSTQTSDIITQETCGDINWIEAYLRERENSRKTRKAEKYVEEESKKRKKIEKLQDYKWTEITDFEKEELIKYNEMNKLAAQTEDKTKEARRKIETEEDEARREVEAEEEEARRKIEEEARRKAKVEEEEARCKAEAEEEEARRKAIEEEARRKAEVEEEEARRKVEAEEEEARRKIETEEEEARHRAEAEEEEARHKAETEKYELWNQAINEMIVQERQSRNMIEEQYAQESMHDLLEQMYAEEIKRMECRQFTNSCDSILFSLLGVAVKSAAIKECNSEYLFERLYLLECEDREWITNLWEYSLRLKEANFTEQTYSIKVIEEEEARRKAEKAEEEARRKAEAEEEEARRKVEAEEEEARHKAETEKYELWNQAINEMIVQERQSRNMIEEQYAQESMHDLLEEMYAEEIKRMECRQFTNSCDSILFSLLGVAVKSAAIKECNSEYLFERLYLLECEDREWITNLWEYSLRVIEINVMEQSLKLVQDVGGEKIDIDDRVEENIVMYGAIAQNEEKKTTSTSEDTNTESKRVIFSPAPEIITSKSTISSLESNNLHDHDHVIDNEMKSVNSREVESESTVFDNGTTEKIAYDNDTKELCKELTVDHVNHFAEELCNIFLRFAVTIGAEKNAEAAPCSTSSAPRSIATSQRVRDETIMHSVMTSIEHDLALALTNFYHTPIEKLSINKIDHFIQNKLLHVVHSNFISLLNDSNTKPLNKAINIPQYWTETIQLLSTRLAHDLMRSASHIMLSKLDDTITQSSELCSEWDILDTAYDSVDFNEFFSLYLNHDRLYGVLRHYLELTQRQCVNEEKKNSEKISKTVNNSSSVSVSSSSSTSSSSSSESEETITKALAPLSLFVASPSSNIALPQIISSPSTLASNASLKQNLFASHAQRVQGAPITASTMLPSSSSLTREVNVVESVNTNGATPSSLTTNGEHSKSPEKDKNALFTNTVNNSTRNTPLTGTKATNVAEVKKLAVITPLSNDAKRAGITQVVLEHCIDSLLEQLLNDSTQWVASNVYKLI